MVCNFLDKTAGASEKAALARAHSKTCRPIGRARSTRSVVECGTKFRFGRERGAFAQFEGFVLAPVNAPPIPALHSAAVSGTMVLAKRACGPRVVGSLWIYMILSGLTILLADTVPTQTVENPTARLLQTVLLMGGMVLMMWLMLFRPQQKKAKELENMLKNLRPGDRIVTSSGIVGVVLSLKDKTISIRSNDTKLEILKSAVAEVTERSGESSSS
jgi:preprotein translocase subunit YajC